VTVLAFRRLPPITRWAILASTVGAAVLSFRVAVLLEPPISPAQAADVADNGQRPVVT